MDKFAPITVFAFNRPDYLQQTLAALAANVIAAQSHITIFCDGPRNAAEQLKTDAVRSTARNAAGFASVSVIEREKNYGCAASVIDGLRQMFSAHDRIVVIEDDILCSPHTLGYLNEGLGRYKDQKSVFSVAAWSPPHRIFPVSNNYPYDVYAIPRFNCWGWASWRDRFDSVDWDVADYEVFKKSPTLRAAFDKGGEDLCGMLDAQMEKKINSWAIRANYHLFKLGCVGIGPVISYVTNIGMKSGTHGTEDAISFDNDIDEAIAVQDLRWMDHIFVDAKVQKQFTRIYKRNSRVVCIIKKMLSNMGLLPLARRVKQKLNRLGLSALFKF